MTLEFEEELAVIRNKYCAGSSEEPMDGDEVDRLINILRDQLNLIEGNMSEEEYIAQMP